MGIYAALGVPEVWRLEGTTLTFNTLQPNGRYAESPSSLAFPLVTPQDLVGFLALRATTEENTVVQQFRTWIRQRRPAAPQAP
jgi:hypothetical protein